MIVELTDTLIVTGIVGIAGMQARLFAAVRALGVSVEDLKERTTLLEKALRNGYSERLSRIEAKCEERHGS